MTLHRTCSIVSANIDLIMYEYLLGEFCDCDISPSCSDCASCEQIPNARNDFHESDRYRRVGHQAVICSGRSVMAVDFFSKLGRCTVEG